MLAQVVVQRGKRFVQQQRLRLGHQGARQGGALALATGYLRWQQIAHRVDAESMQPLLHRIEALAAAWIQPALLQPERHVLAHAQVREQRIVLEHVAQPATLRRQVHASCRIEQGLSLQAHMALAGPQQPGHRLQCQALARARGPEQHHLPLRALQRHVQHEILSGRLQAPLHLQPRGQQQDHDAHHRGQDHQRIGLAILPGLYRFVDGDRQRLRAARNAAGHHQRCAELAHRAREGQQQAGKNAAPGQRQRDPEEHRRFGHAERARGLLQLPVNTLERRACRLEHQRQRGHRCRDHRGLPGEHQVDAEPRLQPRADRAIASDQHQQRRRASNAPSATPSTRLIAVAQPATFSDNPSALQSRSMPQGLPNPCLARIAWPCAERTNAVKRLASTGCALALVTASG
ncbi:hypothetical protein G6F35_010220 [Rhizopus arrhizus]|nr:hypothetical protein G6F35_010220 [Rhizopus arrhizus]